MILVYPLCKNFREILKQMSGEENMPGETLIQPQKRLKAERRKKADETF